MYSLKLSLKSYPEMAIGVLLHWLTNGISNKAKVNGIPS